MQTDYEHVNRRGWAYLAQTGCESTRPYGQVEFKNAKVRLDPQQWIPWNSITRVLCIGSGGGQQAALFASLNYRVVSVDLSAEQLARDRWVSNRFGFSIECVEADMLDLSCLYGRYFDLVYQAVSACYVPSVRRLYQEVARVLSVHGYYRVEHWNPVQLQLAEGSRWRDGAYRITRRQRLKQPIPWAPDADNGSARCWHYIHPLSDLIGGMCDAGLRIIRFDEPYHHANHGGPGSDAHLAEYLPPFFVALAQNSRHTDR